MSRLINIQHSGAVLTGGTSASGWSQCFSFAFSLHFLPSTYHFRQRGDLETSTLAHVGLYFPTKGHERPE